MKGRRKSKAPLKADYTAREKTFFRLCHSCLALNESETQIWSCHRCEAVFDVRAEDRRETLEGIDEDLQEIADAGGVVALRDPATAEEAVEEDPDPSIRNIQGLSVRW